MKKICALTLFACFLLTGAARADVLELASGAKVEGKLIDRNAESITFQTVIGDREYTRKYPLDRVLAVTKDGRREVLGKSSQGTAAESKSSQGAGSDAPVAERSRAEVEELINRLGRTPPDWWDSVPLEYPKTLDLSWPHPAPQPWNNQRNVGQYVWDIINRNPDNWRGGVRFMHHLLTLHKDHPQQRSMAMRDLARMHQNLLQDYARAAFWWRQIGADKGEDYAGVNLAECYWRLGSKAMAMEQLQKSPPTFSMIKLWAEMGEIDQALQMADANVRGQYGDIACVYAGDACRVAGQHAKALQYYRQLLAMPATGQAKKRIERNQQRARANVEAIQLFDTLDISRVPDGVYRAASLGYEAPVEVEVTMKGGRIEAVRVTDHHEKQVYTSLTDTPAKIVAKQGVKGIDATSSATITSEAIINATAKALSKGMK